MLQLLVSNALKSAGEMRLSPPASYIAGLARVTLAVVLKVSRKAKRNVKLRIGFMEINPLADN